MPDISMCKGGSCPLRLHCHRYTAKAEELGQSYFVDPPYKMSMITDDNHSYVGVVTITCSYFWNNDQYEDEKPKN
jgi:hypothetical protein